MEPSSLAQVDWSDFKRRKTWAVLSTICVPFALFLPVVIFVDKSYFAFVAVPVGGLALIANIVFLRRLQVVICPKCGNAFMNQDDNLLISRSAGWKVLFCSECISCGAHRWMD